MKSAIIGYSGFIGSNLIKQYKFTDYYNSQNIGDIKNKKYDLIVSAATKSERWRANQNPKEDWRQIENLLNHLKTVKAGRFVLISTVDVYPCPQNTDEDCPLKLSEIKQAYGRNRFRMEAAVKKLFPKVTILRLPQTFGEGLKKNFVYDLIHDNALDFTHKDSSLQFYNLKNLWKDIQMAIRLKTPVLNLAIEPVTAGELARYTLGIKFTTTTSQPPLKYNMVTKYGKYLYDKKQTLKELKEFISREKAKTKISISNLAWNKNEESGVITILKKYQIAGVEIAPSKIWAEPVKAKQGEIEAYKKTWQENGIRVIATTSLLFGHPELTIFESSAKRDNTLNYLKKMIKLTSDLGAGVMIFGSPKNRLAGKLNKSKVEKISIAFFRKLGNAAKKYNLCFCLEPIPQVYGADYLTNTDEVISLIRKIDHPNIKINLDCGAMKINNENFEKTIEKVLPLTGHMHISEKGFRAISDKRFGHNTIAKTLKKLKYARWASIEMWTKEGKNNIKEIEKTLEFVKKTYE